MVYFLAEPSKVVRSIVLEFMTTISRPFINILLLLSTVNLSPSTGFRRSPSTPAVLSNLERGKVTYPILPVFTVIFFLRILEER